jgi:anaerobic nitric oxide reductase transcription regulator
MPDPFDGLLAADGDALAHPHACMGCRLVVEGEVIGVLTLDALAPRAFDAIPDETVALLAALAGAAMRTALLIEALERGAARSHLVASQLVRDAVQRGGGQLLGTSPAMARLRSDIALVAGSDLTALVTGETGVGKELVAHSIHAQSSRRDQPLIHVNCAALPEAIAESELFGHVRGSFTGAVDHRAGKFEVADGGTLFLDEIGELPLSIQPKLLRALQSGEVQRVGSDKMLRVDVRVIAATNRDLEAEVAAGRFRGDLFHRLRVYPLRVPALRERRDDIALLSGYFLDVARTRLGLGQLRLTADARARLHDNDWAGNVRELEHTILRAALRASAGRGRDTIVIDLDHLGLEPAPMIAAAPAGAAPDGATLRDAVDQFTREMIERTVARCDGNWAEAARRLGVQRGNLHRLATRLGLVNAHRGA